MGLETATYISDLDPDNPVGATDNVDAGDDHIRLLKSTIQATLPNLTGPVTANQTEINYLDGVGGRTGSSNLVLSASPTFTGNIGCAFLTATNTIIANSFQGSLATTYLTGTLPDARVSESNVTQHESALTITESQISDLGSYVVSGGLVNSLNYGSSDTTLTRKAASVLAVEDKAVLVHNDTALTSGEIHISTAAPTALDGSDGDIWLEREI